MVVNRPAGRADCLELSAAEVVDHVKLSSEVVHEFAPNLQALFFLLTISLVQCRLGITGAVGEIGSSFGEMDLSSLAEIPDALGDIMSFRGVSLVRRSHDRMFLGGPFDRDSVEGFDSPLTSYSKPAIVGRSSQTLHRRAENIPLLQLSDMHRYSGGFGFRVLRLDRTRAANETLHLLQISARSLVEGGILVFEGLQGMNQRPGLQEGFHRFMLDEEYAAQRGFHHLEAFAWSGKHGGLFLTSSNYAETYRRAIKNELPSHAFLNTHHDTKFLYGAQVLTVVWEFAAIHFEKLLSRARAMGHVS